MTKTKAQLPSGVAWHCKKHKTFADTSQINCAYCGYPDAKDAKLSASVEKRFDEKFANIEQGNELMVGDIVDGEIELYKASEVKQHLALELSRAEVWKDLEGYVGLYQVSTLGRVRGLRRNKKILKPAISGNGSLTVVLCSYKRWTKSVHRLIAQTFIPNYENKPEVNHIDGDRTNNRVDNLEWVTRSENEKHAYRTGLKSQKGESNFRSKLKVTDIDKIRTFRRYGLPQYEIAKIFGVTPACVSSVCRRITWKHV